MSVKDYLEKSKNGEIDYNDFMEKVKEEIYLLDKQFNFFQKISDSKGRQEGPLFGLPVSFKDSICVKGLQTCAGSKILEGYIPPFDSTVAKRIKESNGLVIGKTNQDEFGFGTFATNSGFGIPKNPLDPERATGGSSGGAGGITQALNYPHIAIGESTGGSISSPAAFCGVVGITPTYGLVSRFGLIDYANSMDKIGPMGKTVWDTAFMLSIIAGHDEKDSTSLKIEKQDYTKFTEEDKKLKIAVPKEYFENIDKNIEKSIWNAIKLLENEGHKVETVSLQMTKYAMPAYYIIATSESSTNLAKFCGMRYGQEDDPEEKGFNEYFSSIRGKYFGAEAKRRIMLGTFARMSGYRDAYYLKALKVRTLIINDFKKVFKKFDAICAPSMPLLPPKFTEIEKLTPLQNYQADVLTIPHNFTGMPSISVPVKERTPIGLHIIGDHLQEGKIISLASQYEKIR